MKKSSNHPKNQKIDKIQLVKNWLLAGRTITQRQASSKFGYDRLSDGIWKLRHRDGMSIKTINTNGQDRYLNNVKYATYKWMGEEPKISFDHKNKGISYYTAVFKFPMKKTRLVKHISEYLNKKRVKNIKSIKTIKELGVIVSLRFETKNEKYNFLINGDVV